ncbi:MAG: N-acetylneuraminate synthase [Cyanobacteria bacterium PR.3.49]|nr:N-acetylneuraminate synthase [Cyanobacteria bacterium PR.3.49]
MKRELVIDSQLISDNTDCYVIAEIGHNHQGDLEKAKQLFKAAKEAGANSVKLQKRDNRSLYTKKLYDSPYDNENSYGDTYGEHREYLEFNKEQYQELQAYAKELDITMFSTAFDFKSADFLADLDMPVYKIASGDLKNVPLLKYVASFNKPMIVSTGGATIDDVQRAYDAIMSVNQQLCLLQCTAAYPVPYEELNLRVITTFRERFPNIVIGLSDHDNGIAMAVAAFVLGARVVEKHFTINRAWKGTDHAFSLEPTGLRKLVRDLKRVPLALGNGVKNTYESEKKPLVKMGKKLVAARDLPAGHILTRDDIAIKSPGDGLPPYELEKILGLVLKEAITEDQDIAYSGLSGQAFTAPITAAAVS